jgi:hypothetical protein
MTRALAAIGLAAFLLSAARAQSTSSQTYEVADVHVGPGVTNLFSRTMFRGGRYEIHNASIVDLIRIAYGIDDQLSKGDKVPSRHEPHRMPRPLGYLLCCSRDLASPDRFDILTGRWQILRLLASVRPQF